MHLLSVFHHKGRQILDIDTALWMVLEEVWAQKQTQKEEIPKYATGHRSQ